MFCRECGKEIPDNATFCPECGHAVQASSSVKGKKPRSALKYVPIAVVAVAGVAFAANALAPKPTASTSGTSREAATITQSAGKEEETAEQTAEQTDASPASTKFFSANQDLNYQNDGSFAYDEERIYTVDYDVDNQVSTIYSTDYQGNNKTVVLSGKWIESIRVVGDKIFYRSRVDINPTQSEYPIGCVNKDGTDDQVIITLPMSLAPNSWFDAKGDGHLAIEGDSLYFNDEEGLKSVSLSGDHEVTVVVDDDKLDDYVLYDNCVFYRHTLSDWEKESAAKSKAGTAAEVPEDKIKKIQGYLYKAQLGSDAKGRPVESDQSFLGELFASPVGLYRRFLTYDHEAIVLE